MTSAKAASPIVSNKIMAQGAHLLVLASASPRRLDLLAQAGITPDAVRPSHIDESVQVGENPRAYALRIARAKAEAATERWNAAGEKPAYILAADTAVACGRRILPKAEGSEDVRHCLKILTGRQHQVLTGIALKLPDGAMRCRVILTRVSFARLSSTEIESYVQTREGEGKAGGYGIQGRAGQFVKRINGSYTNVVGLPLHETVALLQGCGFRPA